MNRRNFLTAGIRMGAAWGLLSSSIGAAQSRYPDRPVRLVVPSSPGGVHDVVARLWVDAVKDKLGGLYVENKAGAGAILGTVEVARAAADGYTLLLGSNSTHVLQPLLNPDIGYDPLRDFQIATVFAATPLVLLLSTKAPGKTAREIADYARANPGKITFAHAGVGTSTHITMELFRRSAGALDMVPVPYRGVSPALADLIAGRVDLMFANLTGQILELDTTGKARIVAVTGSERSTLAPRFPTALEEGFANMVSQSFFGLFAPAKVPDDIIARVADVTQQALADANFVKKLESGGYEVLRNFNPQRARAFLGEELERWRPIMSSLDKKN